MKQAKQVVSHGGQAPVKQQQPQQQFDKHTHIKPPKDARGVGAINHFKVQLTDGFSGTTTSATYTVSINPGDLTIDPRLAIMAGAWANYRFRKLKARWVPNGSAYAAGNQTGEVVINFNGNWYTAPSSSLTMASSKMPAKIINAWESGTVHCTADIMKASRTLRSGLGSQAEDMRLTDILMEVVVKGTPNTSTAGYVELEGEIEFFDDYVQNTTNAPRQNRLFATEPGGSQTLVSGASTNVTWPYANQLVSAIKTGVVENQQIAGNTTYVLYGGSYIVQADVYLSGTTITAANLQIVPSSYSQAVGSGISNVGGSTFSAAAVTVHDRVAVSVPEDSTATVLVNVTCTGTGTLTVSGGLLTFLAV